jgi:AGZA family xanthine/uracil permease-like MFS transporter
MEFVNKFFRLEERKTSVGTEFLAGMTTFLAMSYILVVNSAILSDSGMDFDRVLTATAIAAIVGSLLMGLLANFPIAQAPGMGLNAFFTYGVVFGFGFTFEQALAAVFVSGVLFVLISLSGLREKIINVIPNNLKFAIGGGIGLFIAYIGMVNAGMIVSTYPVSELGAFEGPALIAWIGLVITVILYVLKIKGAIFLGIIATSIIAMIVGVTPLPSAVVSAPAAPYFGAFLNGFANLNIVSFSVVVFSMLFVDFFDTAGTLISVGPQAGLLDENGELQNIGGALLADSTATVVGAVVGTSPTTSYIESLAGIEEGGRTGLTAVFTALFFVVFLFLTPLLSAVPQFAVAPALIFVGILMASQLRFIEWDNIEVAIPAFLTIIVMPLSYSIADGIAVGFIFYTLVKVLKGKFKELDPFLYILSVLFVLYFLFA